MFERITVSAEIPATTANLGPGFDCMGLALEIFDTVRVTSLGPAAGDSVDIQGVGAEVLPRDREHLVLGTLRDFLDAQGWDFGGLHLECVNRIPHGQGLGSSASAIIAALVLGKELARRHGVDVSAVDLFQIGSDIDGHPDNVAPCLFGGLNVSWEEHGVWELAHLAPHPDIRVTLAIPATVLSTKVARELIPPTVPHKDAVRNSARAALCIHAFTTDPRLLLPATKDFLHQDYRAAAYPQSHRLVQRLRSLGVAAAISGAGPAVIMFGVDDPAPAIEQSTTDMPGFFRTCRTGIDLGGARVLQEAAVDGPGG